MQGSKGKGTKEITAEERGENKWWHLWLSMEQRDSNPSRCQGVLLKTDWEVLKHQATRIQASVETC